MSGLLAILAAAALAVVVATLWLRGRQLCRRVDALEWMENEAWLAKIRRPLPRFDVEAFDDMSELRDRIREVVEHRVRDQRPSPHRVDRLEDVRDRGKGLRGLTSVVAVNGVSHFEHRVLDLFQKLGSAFGKHRSSFGSSGSAVIPKVGQSPASGSSAGAGDRLDAIVHRDWNVPVIAPEVGQ